MTTPLVSFAPEDSRIPAARFQRYQPTAWRGASVVRLAPNIALPLAAVPHPPGPSPGAAPGPGPAYATALSPQAQSQAQAQTAPELLSDNRTNANGQNATSSSSANAPVQKGR